MLRADLLAFSALDTFRSLAMTAAGADTAVIEAGIPVVERFVGVHRGEHIGDPDPLRTFAFFDAVAAGGAGDQVQTAEDRREDF